MIEKKPENHYHLLLNGYPCPTKTNLQTIVDFILQKFIMEKEISFNYSVVDSDTGEVLFIICKERIAHNATIFDSINEHYK